MKNISYWLWLFLKILIISLITIFIFNLWFYIFVKYFSKNEEFSCMIDYLNSEKLWIENWITLEFQSKKLDRRFAKYRHIWYWSEMNFLHQNDIQIISKTNLEKDKWNLFNFCYLYDIQTKKLDLISSSQCILFYIFEKL